MARKAGTVMFDETLWFNKLKDSLDNIKNIHGVNLDIYTVEIGPIKFNIILDSQSQFKKALKAFYKIKKVDSIADCFTIFCLDQKYLALLPVLNIKAKDIQDIQEKSKHSKQCKITIYDIERGILKCIDTDSKLGLLYVKDFLELPSWEFYSPLKEYIHFLCIKYQGYLLHAGSVMFDDINQHIGGNVFVGPGGAGKSTTTLYCIQKGAKTTGDDYIALIKQNKSYYVYTIYRTLKIKKDSVLPKLDFLDSCLYEQDIITGKLIYYGNDYTKTGVFTDGYKLSKIQALSFESYKCSFFNKFIISSMGQIPYWLDRSVSIAANILKQCDYDILIINKGKKGLNNIINAIKMIGIKNYEAS